MFHTESRHDAGDGTVVSGVRVDLCAVVVLLAGNRVHSVQHLRKQWASLHSDQEVVAENIFGGGVVEFPDAVL